jgi:hypothetical protein
MLHLCKDSGNYSARLAPKLVVEILIPKRLILLHIEVAWGFRPLRKDPPSLTGNARVKCSAFRAYPRPDILFTQAITQIVCKEVSRVAFMLVRKQLAPL